MPVALGSGAGGSVPVPGSGPVPGPGRTCGAAGGLVVPGRFCGRPTRTTGLRWAVRRAGPGRAGPASPRPGCRPALPAPAVSN